MSELKNKWCDLEKLKELQKKYGKSKQNNFSITDTIPIPHPYVIGSKHISLNEGIYLNIEETEKKGAKCEQRINDGYSTKRCNLKYDDHKTGLLIQCEIPMSDPKDKNKFNKELHKYLLMIKEKLDLKKYDGFGFVDKMGNGVE